MEIFFQIFPPTWFLPMTFPGPGGGGGVLPRSDPGKEEDTPQKEGLIAGSSLLPWR